MEETSTFTKPQKSLPSGFALLLLGIFGALYFAIPRISEHEYALAAVYIFSGYFCSVLGIGNFVFPTRRRVFFSVSIISLGGLISLIINPNRNDLEIILLTAVCTTVIFLLVFFRFIYKEGIRQFNIYVHPKGKYEAVKQGPSWPAFFFGALWEIYKKMYALGLGIIVIGYSVYFVTMPGGGLALIINTIWGAAGLVLSILFLLNGNQWRELNLKSRGFNLKYTVTAINGKNAIADYLRTVSGDQAHQAQAPPQAPPQAHTPLTQEEKESWAYIEERGDFERF